MADVKISELSADASFGDASAVPCVTSGTTKKVLGSSLKSYILSGAYSTTTVSLSSSGWSSTSRTVNVSGVTSSALVFVSPAPTSVTAYAEAGVRCTAQGSGTLTFQYTTKPTTTLSVQVVIFA